MPNFCNGKLPKEANADRHQPLSRIFATSYALSATTPGKHRDNAETTEDGRLLTLAFLRPPGFVYVDPRGRKFHPSWTDCIKETPGPFLRDLQCLTPFHFPLFAKLNLFWPGPGSSLTET